MWSYYDPKLGSEPRCPWSNGVANWTKLDVKRKEDRRVFCVEWQVFQLFWKMAYSRGERGKPCSAVEGLQWETGLGSSSVLLIGKNGCLQVIGKEMVSHSQINFHFWRNKNEPHEMILKCKTWHWNDWAWYFVKHTDLYILWKLWPFHKLNEAQHLVIWTFH